MKKLNSKRGAVSIQVLMFFLVILSLITMLLSNTAVLTVLNSVNRQCEVQGLHIANAGIEIAKDNILRGTTRTQNLKFETGDVVVKIKGQNPRYKIESIAYLPRKESPQKIVRVSTTIVRSGTTFKYKDYDIKYGEK